MNSTERQEELAEVKRKYMVIYRAYSMLVGTLYPSIAYSELVALQSEYVKLGGDAHDLPLANPPTASDHSGGHFRG